MTSSLLQKRLFGLKTAPYADVKEDSVDSSLPTGELHAGLFVSQGDAVRGILHLSPAVCLSLCL